MSDGRDGEAPRGRGGGRPGGPRRTAGRPPETRSAAERPPGERRPAGRAGRPPAAEGQPAGAPPPRATRRQPVVPQPGRGRHAPGGVSRRRATARTRADEATTAATGDDSAGTVADEGAPTATPPAGVPLVRRSRSAISRTAGVGERREQLTDAGLADDDGRDGARAGGRHARAGGTDDGDLGAATWSRRRSSGAATAVDPDDGRDGPPSGDGRLTHLGPVSPYRLRRRHRFPRRVRLLMTLGVVAVLLLVGAVAWYETAANPGKPGKHVLIDVTKGESLGAVTAAMVDKGVVSNGFAFRLSLLLHGTPNVRPGGYVLRRNESFGAVRSALAAGPNVFLVRVPSGFTITEIAKVLGTAPGNIGPSFLAEAKSGAVPSPFQPAPGTSLEGLLGSGTYELLPGETAKELLAQMVHRFDKEATAAGLTPAAATALGYTPYQVVTVASITQKEGYYQKYMGPVARVIYNRLGAGMVLGMTSTVLYALGQDGGTVPSADRTITSPYNTYLNTGLTPTPICSPSPTALKAATSPPAGNWLYFDLVTPKKGVMVFSSTYQQQLAAEKQAQANAASRASGSGGG